MRLKGPFRKIFQMSKGDHGQHAADDGLEYDVPFVHQNHVNLCGDASAQMLLMFNGRPASVAMKPNAGHQQSFRLRTNPRGIVEGGNDGDLVAIVRAAGLRPWNLCPRVGLWNAQLIRSALETYGPYAQSVRFGVAYHWIVVTGTDGQGVIFHDPWRGRNMRKTFVDWITAAGDGVNDGVAATTDQPPEPLGLQANAR
jgi:hypothetical protein